MKAAALQFGINHPVVATTVPGPTSPEEVSENIEMANFEIPSNLWKALKRDKLIDESNSELFPSLTSSTKENELPSGFILYNIINSVYRLPALKYMQQLTYLCMLLLPLSLIHI